MGGEGKKDDNSAMNIVLKIPLIVEKILRYCNFADKKTFRLLNKLWRNSTLEEWRKCATFQLRVSFAYPYSCLLTLECFEDFLERGEKGQLSLFRLQQVPFRRFNILYGNLEIPPDPEDNSEAWIRTEMNELLKLIRFLNKFGSTLEYLKIDSCEFSLGAFEFILKWIVKKACRELKELSIESCRVSGWSYRDPNKSTLLPRVEENTEIGGKLTKLNILIRDNGFSSHVEGIFKHIWDNLFSSASNLKIFKYSSQNPWERPGLYGLFQANPKCLKDQELKISIGMKFKRRSQYTSFEELNRYFEMVPPPKQLQIGIEFKSSMHDWVTFPTEMSPFHEFFIRNGHLPTDLELEVPETYFDNPFYNKIQLSFLTGHYFPNLTHFTLFCTHYCGLEEYHWTCSVYFDFEALKGMPNLERFCWIQSDCCGGGRCRLSKQKLTQDMLKSTEVMPWREGIGLNEAYENPIELGKLKEFRVNSRMIWFDVDGLRIVLGWMKNVKKLVLNLNNETFPVVVEMLPDLKELVLTGQSKTEVSKAEISSGVYWMDQIERERQEEEWREKRKEKEWWRVAEAENWMRGVQLLERAKERRKKERRRAWVERKRDGIEREEKEWIKNQGESGWIFVSYRKKRSKVRLPPRSSNSRSGVDDSLVFAELLKKKATRIFRNYGQTKFIEYKVGGVVDKV